MYSRLVGKFCKRNFHAVGNITKITVSNRKPHTLYYTLQSIFSPVGLIFCQQLCCIVKKIVH